MIIEKVTEAKEASINQYKVYELKEMKDSNDKTVNVKQLKRTVRKEDVESRISQLTSEIERLTEEKTNEEAIITEINKLN